MGLVAPKIDLTFFGLLNNFRSAVGLSNVSADEHFFSSSRTDNLNDGLRFQRCASRGRAPTGDSVLCLLLRFGQFTEQFFPWAGRCCALIKSPATICRNRQRHQRKHADHKNYSHQVSSLAIGGIN